MLKVKGTGSLYYGKDDDLPIGPIILNTETLTYFLGMCLTVFETIY